MKSLPLGRRVGDRRDRQRGAALVELAVVGAMLCMVVLGVIDFGRISYTAMALTNAARAGAMYGAQPNKSADSANMRITAENSASADIGAITVTTHPPQCECQVGGVTTVMLTCASACAGTIRTRVNVTTSKVFNMFTKFPGLPGTVTISRTAIMRAQ